MREIESMSKQEDQRRLRAKGEVDRLKRKTGVLEERLREVERMAREIEEVGDNEEALDRLVKQITEAQKSLKLEDV